MVHILELILKKSYDLILMKTCTVAIEGINTEQGLINCGGSMEAYREVLESFLEDTGVKIREFKPLLKRAAKNISDTEMQQFSRASHAIKGVSAIIGAQDLSIAAAGLEKAFKSGDRAAMQISFPAFYQDLKTTAERVQSFLNNSPNGGI